MNLFNHILLTSCSSKINSIAKSGTVMSLSAEIKDGNIKKTEETKELEFYKKILNDGLVFNDVNEIKIEFCLFDSCQNFKTAGGAIFIGNKVNISTIESCIFHNCSSNSAGAVSVFSLGCNFQKNCIIYCKSKNYFDAINYNTDSGKFTDNTICECSSANIMTSFYTVCISQFETPKITNVNFSRNVNNGIDCCVSVARSSDAFFINTIFENNTFPQSGIIRAEKSIMTFFGYSFVINNNISYIFDFYSYANRQIFDSYFYKTGEVFFYSRKPNPIALINCFLDFEVTCSYILQKNCTIINKRPDIVSTEQCIIDEDNFKPFFSTLKGRLLVCSSVILVLIITCVSIIAIYKKHLKDKQKEKFYTDKFFTEFLSTSQLLENDI